MIFDLNNGIWKEKLKNNYLTQILIFLNMYTRATLREVMIALFPYESMINSAGRAFCGMTKKRMYKHLLGYAVLKGLIVLPYYYE